MTRMARRARWGWITRWDKASRCVQYFRFHQFHICTKKCADVIVRLLDYYTIQKHAHAQAHAPGTMRYILRMLILTQKRHLRCTLHRYASSCVHHTHKDAYLCVHTYARRCVSAYVCVVCMDVCMCVREWLCACVCRANTHTHIYTHTAYVIMGEICPHMKIYIMEIWSPRVFERCTWWCIA